MPDAPEVEATHDWAGRFEELDRAPWPGPRPISLDQRAQLQGRDADGQRFLAAVIDHLLVVLTADSGVGKSSLLRSRLDPDLRASGFEPVYLDDWHFDDGASPGYVIAQALLRQLRVDPSLVPAGTSEADIEIFWRDVDAHHGDRLVLLLDQFEELVRYQPRLFQQTLDWLAQLNRRHRIRVVISLRAEYHHQLRRLEAEARPFTMTTVRLEPLASSEIGNVIDAYDHQVGAIDPTAGARIEACWKDLQRTDDRPGLLHLQGLLYALHHAERQPRSRGITTADVDAFESAAGGRERLFSYGLEQAIATKLEHCRQAARDVGLDPILVDGADALIHRVLPTLSSGGFKLVLSEWAIAQRALAAEIGRSSLDADECRQLYLGAKQHLTNDEHRALRDATQQQWTAPGLALLSDGRGYAWRDWVPWVHDPLDLSSGPMLGMPQALVMAQEMRRFAFAMRWLEIASLVRRSAPAPDTTMVALVHDGFGAALERRYAQPRETFAQSVARISGAVGEALSWAPKEIDEHRGRSELVDGRLVLANLRWRDCAIKGSRDAKLVLQGMVFVNCDLRGTRFEHCSFQGVTFVNCLLDNAAFIECDLVGGTGLDRMETREQLKQLVGQGDPELPDFTVRAPAGLVGLLHAYRGTPAGTTGELYSRTSGIAAHQAQAQYAAGTAYTSSIPWTPATGSLAMYGGRLSSLLVRGCTFHPGPADGQAGCLSLRHIAGASLDLVEHQGGRLEIVDSTIRGLTVTAPVDPDGEPGETLIEIFDAVVANTWFGAGLRGHAELQWCLSAQLTNLNDADFTVRWDEETDISVGSLDDRSAVERAFRAAPQGPPFDDLRKMDYRSQPARDELGRG